MRKTQVIPGFRPLCRRRDGQSPAAPKRRVGHQVRVDPGPCLQREQQTRNRSAGRIEDALWDALLRKARLEGLSSTDVMREMVRAWTGEPDAAEPAPRVLRDAGSAVDAVGLDRSG